MRKSTRMKAPSKEFFAEEFVGEQWRMTKRPSFNMDPGEGSNSIHVTLNGLDSSDLNPGRISQQFVREDGDVWQLEEIVMLRSKLKELQT